jgi:hypothetical protein
MGDPTRDNSLSQSSVQDRFSGARRHWRPSLLTDTSPPADTRPPRLPRGWETLRGSVQTRYHNRDNLANDTPCSSEWRRLDHQARVVLRQGDRIVHLQQEQQGTTGVYDTRAGDALPRTAPLDADAGASRGAHAVVSPRRIA